jgi:hypothetical protein
MPVTWHGPDQNWVAAKLSQIPYSFDNALVAQEVFPEGELDADLQCRFTKTNSWRLKLGTNRNHGDDRSAAGEFCSAFVLV